MKKLVFTAAAVSGVSVLMGASIAHACYGPGTALVFGNSPIFPGAKKVSVMRVPANVPSRDTANVFKGGEKSLNALVVEFPNGEKEYHAFTTDKSGKKLLCNFDQTGANQCFDFEGRTSTDSSLLLDRPSEPRWIPASKENQGRLSYSYSFGTKEKPTDRSDLTVLSKDSVSLVMHPSGTEKQIKLTFDFSKNELRATSIVDGKPRFTYSNQFDPNARSSYILREETADLNKFGELSRVECKFFKTTGGASAEGNSIQGSKVESAN